MTRAEGGLAVGFVGTGIMGGHMARRLAHAGHRVTAWNRSRTKAEALAVDGVAVADEPRLAAAGGDIVLCMLSSGPVCDEVLLAPGGVLDAMRPGSTLVVMSSIPVETAEAQARRASERGVRYLDAPVSGGERGAAEGTLAIMAGGDEDAFRDAGPVLAPLGRATRVGPAGTGQLAKLVNQLMVASNICAVAEALLLAERGGADPARVRDALLGGFADSTVLRQHGPRMIEGDFKPGGPAKYQVKDTSTALAFARGRGLDLPVAALVDRLFTDLVAHGGGDLDHSAVILELRRRIKPAGAVAPESHNKASDDGIAALRRLA
jgi:3-hydroxyisobutyrate dehydrogenase-like beta-hydroxyacid dehydrogenase